MTPKEILQKHEDANEMHFHEVDRKFIIEAMEEYAQVCHNSSNISDKQQTAVQWLIEQIMDEKTSVWKKEIEQALEMERKQIEAAYRADTYPCSDEDAEQYFTDTYQSTK